MDLTYESGNALLLQFCQHFKFWMPTGRHTTQLFFLKVTVFHCWLLVMVNLPKAPELVSALPWPNKKLMLAKHQVLALEAGALSVETQETDAKSGTGLYYSLAPILSTGVCELSLCLIFCLMFQYKEMWIMYIFTHEHTKPPLHTVSQWSTHAWVL